ncbi:MAG: hypothetical protein H0V73_09045 [Chloroflexi bacterium]|nr:hypothetical protein [Chloroflexota bacterium]
MGAPLYVAGGRQRELRSLAAGLQDWYEYDQAVLLSVDRVTGAASRIIEYVSPPEVCPAEDPAILFKSGTLSDGHLYLCTQTEAIVLDATTLAQTAYVSLPLFNDVHHVRPTPAGNLLIANTGLDMVLEVTLAGDVVHEWNVTDQDPWDRFSRETDYRRIKSTKPHLAHPNHVFYIGDEPWATRFEFRDAISLADPSRRIEIGLERLHDGLVQAGHVYFTTVDGKVVIADTTTLQVVDVVDLATLHPPDTRLGWCRGILIDGTTLWAGFSRIRPTKFRENVGWVIHGFRRDAGTHIAAYDLSRRTVLQEFPLESAGLSAVFSIFDPGAS